jgi:peptidyl-dipeptidase A
MKIFLPGCIALLLFACGVDQQPTTESEGSAEAQAFLDSYTSTFVDLYYKSAEAEWKLNTYIVEGDTITPQQD